MALDLTKVFKGIQQVKALPANPEKGVIYFVREHVDGNPTGNASVYFGGRLYGNVEATRLAKIESDILALDGRVDAIEGALGEWTKEFAGNLQTVASVVKGHATTLGNHSNRLETLEVNFAENIGDGFNKDNSVSDNITRLDDLIGDGFANDGSNITAEILNIKESLGAEGETGRAIAAANANASAAVETANEAKSTADKAKEIAEGAVEDVTAQVEAAQSAQAAAEAAQAGAEGHASAADQSAKDAAAAKGAAETAKGLAESAKAGAVEAQAAAEAAQAAAEDLLAEVSDANTSASAIAIEAKNAATSAVTTANEAKTIVDGLTVVKTTPSDTTIKEEYKFMSGEEQLGETIKIYKDSSIVSLELVDKDKDGNSGQFLKYTYLKADGSEDVVYVNVSDFLTQSEFGNGLTVSEAGVVSVLKDAASESYLTVSENGIKVSGIDAIKSTADTAVQTVSVAEGCEMLSATKEGTTVTLALYYGGDDAE